MPYSIVYHIPWYALNAILCIAYTMVCSPYHALYHNLHAGVFLDVASNFSSNGTHLLVMLPYDVLWKEFDSLEHNGTHFIFEQFVLETDSLTLTPEADFSFFKHQGWLFFKIID